MPDNPFIPSFGVSPLYLAGRDEALAAVKQVALNLARTDYSRACLIVGSRGIGKTVLLNAVEDAGRQGDWLMVSTTASRGFLARMITEQLQPMLDELRPGRGSKLSAEVRVGAPSVATGAVKIEEDDKAPAAPSLRRSIFDICEAAPERGLLFTIDEIGTRARDELEEFATVYQHAVREGLNVAVVMCGIPANINPLVDANTGPVTFLNRARRVDIDLLPKMVARAAFEETIGLRATRTGETDAIDRMVSIARGYPFLIQEVGNKAWDVRPDAPTISLTDVESIEPAAMAAMFDSVLQPIYRSLAPGLRAALYVLATDEQVTTSQMATRLGREITAVSGIQQRLVQSGVAVRTERGRMRIVVPYLGAYVLGLGEPDERTQKRLDVLDEYDS